MTRIVTNEDVIKYKPMVNMYINKYVKKNWNEAANKSTGMDITLGNTGMSINDIYQTLMTEVVVALHNYNPNYRTKENKSVQESTFVYQHLFHRCGQLCKKLTNKSSGYGVWMHDLHEIINGPDNEQ